jgi:hypothetical protein
MQLRHDSTNERLLELEKPGREGSAAQGRYSPAENDGRHWFDPKIESIKSESIVCGQVRSRGRRFELISSRTAVKKAMKSKTASSWDWPLLLVSADC